SKIATKIVTALGDGVEGVVQGRRYRCGRPEWVGALGRLPLPPHSLDDSESTVVALADETEWIALFKIKDALRPGARELVERLQRMGIEVTLLSGDRACVVEVVAGQL